MTLAATAGVIQTQGGAGWLWTSVCSPMLLFLNLLGPCHIRPWSDRWDGSVRIAGVTTGGVFGRT